ncbi:hypothetical protein M426DRAFT_243098 [Hypoxylon sp. CI-4A]|nr:hypothetical protein M426DRAFT_243098 [Hypoxylon sp. CI-4A]
MNHLEFRNYTEQLFGLGDESRIDTSGEPRRVSADPRTADLGPVTRYPSQDAVSDTIAEPSPSDYIIHDIEPKIPDASTPDPPQDRVLRMRESLGIWVGVVIIGGIIGSLAGLGFLIFLWTAHGSDEEATDAPHAWRAIMISGWMTQATTLCAVLIRIVVGAQATVCTAMLASLILEGRGVRKSHVVQFSVM